MDDFNFLHVNLNEVNPDFDNLPTEFYTLRWTKGEIRTYQKDGENRQRISVSFTVAAPTEVAGQGVLGRRIFESFFPTNMGKKILRWISDCTGVVQRENTGLDAWLADMNEQQPLFRVTVTEVEEKDRRTGEMAKVNRIVWKDIAPAM